MDKVNDLHPDDIPVVERILTDCADMQARGVALRRGEWGIVRTVRSVFVAGPACCPGGAVIVRSDGTVPTRRDFTGTLAALVDRPRAWVCGFVYGIDGVAYMVEPSELRGYAAGLVVAAALWGEG